MGDRLVFLDRHPPSHCDRAVDVPRQQRDAATHRSLQRRLLEDYRHRRLL